MERERAGDWDPEQYHRFAGERAQPFVDLLALVRADRPFGRAVDLGCGSGELTALAAERFAPRSTVGIDSSTAMLRAAVAHASGRLRFEHGDLAGWTSGGDHDLVIANASLHWVPRHHEVLARWRAALAPGGQLAVQVPANASMPSHTVAAEVAKLPEFAAAFGADGPPPDPVAEHVLEPEEYARLLHDLGFAEQHVRLQVYPHLLSESREVVEWVRGTTLTRFRRRLPAEVFERFVEAYEARLLEVIGRHRPYFFPFRRILLWGRLPG